MRDNAWLGFSNGGARNFPDSAPARSSGGFTRMDVGPVFNLEDMLRKQVLVTNEINFQFCFPFAANLLCQEHQELCMRQAFQRHAQKKGYD